MEVSRIGSSVRIQTPAKLNLFLEVLARRDDGFHEIETLMTAVRICDTLYVSRSKQRQIHLTSGWATGVEASAVSRAGTRPTSALNRLPAERDNLVWKAVDRLRQRAGADEGATIRLIKRIPAAAGLGGASSDAAAALVAANHVWGLNWSHDELAEVAAEIGSDVAFFLHAPTHGADVAICRGRGEQIVPLAGIATMHFVIVCPPEGLSTAAVYRACRPAESPVSTQPLLSALRRGNPDAVGRCLFNRLQATAEELSSWVGKARRIFDQLGCQGHQMSGSGTSYFAICRHARHARRLLAVLRGAGFQRAFHAETATTPHRLEIIPA